MGEGKTRKNVSMNLVYLFQSCRFRFFVKSYPECEQDA